MSETDAYIKKVFKFYLLIFFILGLYLAYVMGVQSDALSKNPTNPRNNENLSHRGKIYTRSGKLLAFSQKKRAAYIRVYPKGEAYEPLLGYVSRRYGKDGIEKYLDEKLRSGHRGYDLWKNIIRYKPRGDDIYLTIDDRLQELAYSLLNGYRGAVIVMNPKNNEILALVSSPSYDPSKLEDNFQNLKSSKDAPFLLRPVTGMYAPGSVFKVFTYASCIENGAVTPDETFACNGDFQIPYEQGIYHVRDAGGTSHGTLTAVDALVHSCNISFAQMGLKLGSSKFIEMADRFGLNSKPDFQLALWDPHFPKPEDLTQTQLAQTAFGQGQLSLAPMQIALMVSAVANKGRIMIPHIVKLRLNEKKKEVYRAEPMPWRNAISPYAADAARDAMIQVVERGTGYRARLDGISVAGKTGSAENPAGETHAWFACFAPADDPKLLVVVIVENAGAGGQMAAPIAAEILKAGLK